MCVDVYFSWVSCHLEPTCRALEKRTGVQIRRDGDTAVTITHRRPTPGLHKKIMMHLTVYSYSITKTNCRYSFRMYQGEMAEVIQGNTALEVRMLHSWRECD